VVVKTDNSPSDSHLKRGRGMGGEVAVTGNVVSITHPLRLTFEAREGVEVVNKTTT